MLEFTGLERTVLSAICDGQPGLAERERLRELLATAQPSERDNTGHGFYTSFEVDRAMPPIDWPLFDGANAEVDVEGETLLMGFVLLGEDGYPDCLEGFQYGTRTGDNIDLTITDLNGLRWLRPMS